eukprot:TRINITY_DN1879_c0_g1_i3.p2 TRINITY_DN1879_c0_g1~~TRINITY_DN1879_c0_g1_i3.p2  ORF type:complete len:181 (-),score=30.49 TRINITY_DN1879_c0_g1_i3:496-1038(-)
MFLVEDLGRSSLPNLDNSTFSPEEPKGLRSGSISFNNQTLDKLIWQTKVLDLSYDNLKTLPFKKISVHLAPIPPEPAIYRGKFESPEVVGDCFVVFKGGPWVHGAVWINGFFLGRYWNDLGPQLNLFVPGSVLKSTGYENELMILELEHVYIRGLMPTTSSLFVHLMVEPSNEGPSDTGW